MSHALAEPPPRKLVDDRFRALAELFFGLFQRPEHGGGAVAVYLHGEPVVDIWAGYAAPERLWRHDTVSLSFSTGKGVAATLVHRLVERGLLEYDEPIASYWPEFATAGKERITVRDILIHRSGLHRIRGLVPGPPDRLLDDDAITAALERAAPDPRRVRAAGYHAFTQGHLIAELVRRVTGREFTDVLRTEIAEPLGIEEFWFRVPPEQRHRIATRFPALTLAGLDFEHSARLLTATRFRRALVDALMPAGVTRIAADPRVHDAVQPAWNGVFSARALARMYGAIANQGMIGGREFLRPSTIDLIGCRQDNGAADYVFGIPVPWALGYHRVPFLAPNAHIPIHAFGHFGLGGSGGFAEPRTGLALAFVTNRLGNRFTPLADLRFLELTAAARRAVREHLPNGAQ